MRKMHARLIGLIVCLVTLCSSGLAQGVKRTVALTFDDLPKALGATDKAGGAVADIRATTEHLLKALRAHKATAIGFVNEDKLYVPGQTDERIAVLQRWLDAGMTLGNHTFSHPDLNKLGLAEYEDDVIHGEVVWRRLMEAEYKRMQGRVAEPRYFRHPYTHTGETKAKKDAFEAFLKSRGYAVAPFTVDLFDWGFNAIYTKALAAGDKDLAQRIQAAYIEHVDTMFGFFEQRSRDLFGREIPQVLLVHANDINGDSLDQLLGRLEKRGYSFISIGAALADPAYATKDDYVGEMGPSWLHRWSVALGKPMHFEAEPDPPKWIIDKYNGNRCW